MRAWLYLLAALALILFALSRHNRRAGSLSADGTRHDPGVAGAISNLDEAVSTRVRGLGAPAAGHAACTQIVNASDPTGDGTGSNDERARPTSAHGSARNPSPGEFRCIAANVVASDTEMVFAIVRVDGSSATVIQQAVVPGNMRLPETFVPEPGIYVRVLAASGELLAQTSLPDPRLVYHDEPVPDGGGLLRGGAVMLPSAEINVRFPRIAGMDRVELFLIDDTSDVGRLTPASKEFRGSFTIKPSAR